MSLLSYITDIPCDVSRNTNISSVHYESRCAFLLGFIVFCYSCYLYIFAENGFSRWRIPYYWICGKRFPLIKRVLQNLLHYCSRYIVVSVSTHVTTCTDYLHVSQRIISNTRHCVAPFPLWKDFWLHRMTAFFLIYFVINVSFRQEFDQYVFECSRHVEAWFDQYVFECSRSVEAWYYLFGPRWTRVQTVRHVEALFYYILSKMGRSTNSSKCWSMLPLDPGQNRPEYEQFETCVHVSITFGLRWAGVRTVRNLKALF